ncbi:MAG: TonB-dependent receptor [Alphaproteobacteria bacterium]|nr:TonB-dependent receptor [Alphaproteobacteria bacterium]
MKAAGAGEVPEIVVTPTRFPTELGRVGSSVSVLTGEDIARREAQFALDVLSSLPGLATQQLGPPGTSSSVRLRGQGPEGTLLLIDGIEVSDPAQAQTQFDFSQLLLGSVDRIEVLRGSQSVLYGGDAVGGVVNILTERGRGAPHGALFAEAGSFGTLTGGGRIAGGLGADRIGYSAYAQYLVSDGFSAADTDLPGNDEADGYENSSFGGRLDAVLTDGALLKLAGRFAEGTASFDACGGAFCDDPDRGEHFVQIAGRAALELTALEGALTGEVGIGHAGTEHEGFDDEARGALYRGARTKIDGHATWLPHPDHAILLGAETELEAAETDLDPDGSDIRIDGYYALYQGTFGGILTLSAGGRIDDHETFGSFSTHRFTLALHPLPGMKIHASQSTGFRAPSLFELFGACCGDPNFGNPALDPEESRSVDAGVEQTLWSGRARLDLTWFRITTRNEIIFDGTVFGDPSPNYVNVPGRTRSEGIEASADLRLTGALDLRLAYTVNEVTADDGRRLQNRPRHVGSANLNAELWEGRGNVNLTLSYFADTLDTDFSTFPAREVKLEDPLLLSLAARLALRPGVEAYLRAGNLLDADYQTEFGYGTAGPSASLGLRLTL